MWGLTPVTSTKFESCAKTPFLVFNYPEDVGTQLTYKNSPVILNNSYK